jgi:hypothetical protein
MRVGFLVLAAVLAGGCGSSQGRSVEPSADGLPPYTTADAPLFDDGLSPEVFAGEVERAEPTEARARAADGIARVRFVTVTRDSTGDGESYALEVSPSGPPIKGTGLPATIGLTLGASNPSYALVRNAEAGLVGVAVLMFYKRFNESGRAVTRWHIEADNQRVNKAIERARWLGELRK